MHDPDFYFSFKKRHAEEGLKGGLVHKTIKPPFPQAQKPKSPKGGER